MQKPRVHAVHVLFLRFDFLRFGHAVPHARHALTAERQEASMETMETKSVSQVSEGGGQRADVIVEAACRLFLAPGSVRVSMDDLARELGMSKKTIYRHFPDKRSLLAAVLDRQF
ncbi:TetR/AcrR family transcriptional regulator, partial [Streptomyces mirabilis]|uniref:TetR/AcrR family transcriptional regulator n=1 Tax=Streptomyces mirabilis TaxID=68239 RepID=UPI0036DD85B3